MASPSNWNNLSHQEKMELFLRLNDEEIIRQYLPTGLPVEEFRRQLLEEKGFWVPGNIEEFKVVDQAPTKETTIGAWRDLSRAEAILELIDNSIDAWTRRREKYPNQTADKLMIFIDIDRDNRVLKFEDNAGGVDEANLANLIIPGHSETLHTDKSIGSYRTGGKKAVFKLASEVSIWTRYSNPVGTTDEAFEIQLDRKWLNDPTDYRFVYAKLKDKGEFSKGQTVYKFRLHGPISEWDWDVLEGIEKDIRRNYTLLLLRNPKIAIYFNNRTKSLEPFADMYKFTEACDSKKGLDLRPQRVRFKTELDCNGQKAKVIIEIVLGCRITTGGSKDQDGPGIDLYGNDRLFSHQEYELFRNWYESLPKNGNPVRGFINIHGPNFIVPWDTHKRHANLEREVVQVLKQHPAIRQLFAQWAKAYKGLANSPEIKRTIQKPLSPWKKQNDLNIPFSSDVEITAGRHRNAKLPQGVHEPHVPEVDVDKPIEVKLSFSKRDFKLLCKEHEIDCNERDAAKQLAEVLQDSILSQIS